MSAGSRPLLSVCSRWFQNLTAGRFRVTWGHQMKPSDKLLSRRQFTSRTALGSLAASACWLPFKPNIADLVPPAPAAAETSAGSDLSPQGQVEAEARFQSILSQYPGRFSEAQKADLKRLCLTLQPQLEQLRAWPVGNPDQPALYLKPLVEREKKSKAAPNLKLAPSAIGPSGKAQGKPNSANKH